MIIWITALGWAALLLGYQPVQTLRLLQREVWLLPVGWGVIASILFVESTSIWHWYLIFGLFCIIAARRLDKLSGKMLLAASAALSLSLGVIFYVQQLHANFAAESQLDVLIQRYLQGWVIALACVTFFFTRHDALMRQSGACFDRRLFVGALAWLGATAAPLLEQKLTMRTSANLYLTLIFPLVISLLALSAILSLRSGHWKVARIVAPLAAAFAILSSLVVDG